MGRELAGGGDLHSGWEGPDHPYAGRMAALATKHGKLPLIGPVLERAIGLKVIDAPVDTDVLGTFTGDVPRLGSPLETAIAKARLGMEAAGEELGLASEGSIGPDPSLPFVVSDEEIVVLVDDAAGLVVWESVRSFDIVSVSAKVRPEEDLDALLSRAGFPAHMLTVRPNSGAIRPIWKGIGSRADLEAAIGESAAVATDGLARVETDMRAHTCPSRREVIAEAARRLANRLAARCPLCEAPGWGNVDQIFGVPCSWCGTEVLLVRAEIRGCAACGFRSLKPIRGPQERADPGQCPACNP